MEVNTIQYKHCDLVKVNGRIDSATAPKLAEALGAITDDGRFKIVVNFSGVEFLSSAGLRALIYTQKICKRYNRGEVVLCAMPANIAAAIELAGFNSIFKIFDDPLMAVGSF
jgi:anti-sigma B factor antagonist